MRSTEFHHKDGSTSSVRTSFGGFSSTTYVGSACGGITSRAGGTSIRMDSDGRFLGSGYTTRSGTTYFGRNGSVHSHLPAYTEDDSW